MDCLVLSSPHGKKAWSLCRTTELIAFDADARRVQILFMLLAMNKFRKGRNCLRMMHRGNAECRLEAPWPLPRHPAENPESPTPILHGLYGNSFKEEGGRVRREKLLTPWDSWHGVQAPDLVRPWPPAEGVIAPGNGEPWLRKLAPENNANGYTPLSLWELGPFEHTGLYLVAFLMTLSGPAFDSVFQSSPVFVLGGPKRLLSRIKYSELPMLDAEDRDELRRALEEFRDPERRLSSASYDIVLLGPPSAASDRIRICKDECSNGIYPAPIQPKHPGIQRLLARDQCFTIALTCTEEAVGAPA